MAENGKNMKTVIIGGGKGCKSLLKLATGSFLRELTLDVRCVVDIDPNAPGMKFAKEIKIPISTDIEESIAMPGIELIIELTGLDEVLDELHKMLPHGMKLIDHHSARIFWDLVNAQQDQEQRLKEIIELEQRIENERQFLQNIFDGIPDLVVVLDKDRNVIRVNKRFRDNTGIETSEAIGKNCHDVFSMTDLAFDCQLKDCPFEEVFKTNNPHTVVRRTPSPNETYYEVTMTPILGAEGTPEVIIGTWYRITEKVKLKREIEAAEIKFKRFIESAHAMISIKDLDGRYVIVNSATAEVFNRKPEEFIGKKAIEVLPPDIARSVQKHDQEVIKHKQHQTYDEILPIDGRIYYINTIRFPLTDYKGSVIGTCAIDRDVTRERELQEQLVQATKLAAVGKLAAGVAHEINNPLTGILAYAEDIMDELPDNSPLQDDLSVIVRETMRCRNIVHNLLDFSRVETPKIEKIKPSEVIDKTLELVEKLANFKDVEIRKDLISEEPHIRGDLSQLTQVMLNFMINAADAMNGRGRITLKTEQIPGQDKFAISVEDTGPGIPENLIDKIFDPFFSTKDTNGLGLAVSWGIIERHHGTVEVDMADEGGAIFKILLPVSRRANNVAEPA